MTARIDHAQLMDRVYRRQRHVYDATRKFYLLGRDPMIAGLNPPAHGSVLEIGCGTGRNLVKVGQRYRDVSLYGVDISREMLASAGTSIEAAGLRSRCRLALADAEKFDPLAVFGREKFDRIFISYAVSMIPQWRAVMAQAFVHLAPGGELHIVDFGDMAQMPRWSRSALYTWLRWYHVTPRPDLFHVAAEIARAGNGHASTRRLYNGFAWISVVTADNGAGPSLPAEVAMPAMAEEAVAA